MSPNVVQRLAEIRELQGKDPLPDPSHIEGFGQNLAPPPGWTPPTSTHDFEDPDEFADEDEPSSDRLTAAETLAQSSSPLVRAAQPKPVAMPLPDLAILDSEAAFLGRTVSLNDSEQRQVKAIIVKALQRDLRGQMSALKSMEPRRQRKSKPVESQPTPEATSEAPVRKKRGRPRGSLLK